jgi:hypothetical protein
MLSRIPAFVAIFVLAFVGSAPAQYFTSAPILWWNPFAGSASGQYLYAPIFFGGIWKSSDSGKSWTKTAAPSEGYVGGCASADGSQVYVGVQGGRIQKSTDFGVTWNPVTTVGTSSSFWQWMACSSDGTKIAAAIGSVTQGDIFYSTNSGATWTDCTNALSRTWAYITMPGDGSKIVASNFSTGGGAHDDGGNYISTDGACATWTQIGAAANGSTNGMVMYSRDGSVLWVAYNGAGSTSKLFKSTNNGSSYTQASPPGVLGGFLGVATSANGSVVVLGQGESPSLSNYISTDGGATWNTIPGSIGPGAVIRGGNVANFVNAVVSDNGQVILISNFNSALQWTTNGGVSWSYAPAGALP